ncbi:MAG: mechanosensitive ion channel family protein [Treponema sp.]|nr:mechanosensitive ion channel family protein [Treponema sp.]
MEEEIAETVVAETIETTEKVIEGADIVSPLGTVGSEVAEQTTKFFHLDEIKQLFTVQSAAKIAVAVVTIAILFGIYKFLKRLVNKKFASKLQAHSKLLLNKAITYVFYILTGMYILSCIGVNLSAVWGAAGVAGLAIGFAAQTSVSNIISGLFVLSEKALRVGDFIEVNGVSGIVDSIDLLSVMVHTHDNQMIRIPNSAIINDTFKNYSHFKTRRMVYDIPVSYDYDMEKVMAAVKRVPSLCPTVLENPEPTVYYDGFGEAVNLKLCVWIKNSDFIQNKTEVFIAIRKELQKDGFDIPFTRYDIKLINNSAENLS